MAKITIGDTTYTVPELTFIALERAWPYVQASMVSDGADPMRGPNAALRIISAGILHGEHFDPNKFDVTAGPDEEDLQHDQLTMFLRRKMKANQISTLSACIGVMLEEAGLVVTTGEVPPVEEGNQESSSTATVLPTLQN